MSESNSLLAKQIAQNDDSAFAELFARYYALVFRVCLRFLGHRQDAEDATQETFSRVARYIGRWDPARPLEPWLVAIAGNRCRTLLARKRGFRPLSQASEPVTNETDAAHEADSLREEISLALSLLRPEQRRAFDLFHNASLSYQQIATELECPVGTVKTWIHRARRQVISQLREREVVQGPAEANWQRRGEKTVVSEAMT